MKKTICAALALVFSLSTFGQNSPTMDSLLQVLERAIKETVNRVLTQNGLTFPLTNNEPAIKFTPDLATQTGWGKSIAWFGDTGSEGAQMPYKLSSYFANNGAFYTGVWTIISNKRFSVAGDIMGISALADGSEPNMLSISPDIDGPGIGIESLSKYRPDGKNQSAIAFYNLDQPIPGTATPYSSGYHIKRAAIMGDGGWKWGRNLGTNIFANADIGELLVSDTGLHLRSNLSLQGKLQLSETYFEPMTDDEMRAIQNPKPGRVIYNTTHDHIYFYKGGIYNYWSSASW